MYREGVRLVYAVLMDIQLIVTMDNSCRPINCFSNDQVNIVPFLQYYNSRWIMHQKDIITTYPITFNYGISPMRSNGNPAVKIEGGGGQQCYLYTVKIENFRQILMLSLSSMRHVWHTHLSVYGAHTLKHTWCIHKCCTIPGMSIPIPKSELSTISIHSIYTMADVSHIYMCGATYSEQ